MSNNIAKSAIWVTFSEILFNLSGFIIHSVLGRFLGPADYGRYGIIITLTTMVIILIGNGIPTAMSKYISEYFETNAGMVKAIKKQAIILQSIIIGGITLIFFFSIPFICKALGDPSLIPLFRISTLIIPSFAAASFYFSYYTGLHKFNIQASLKMLRSVTKIAFAILLAYFFKVEGAIVGYILAPISVFVAAIAIDRFRVSKEINSKIQTEKENVFPWKNLVNYAWQIIIFFLAYELLISIDLYMVKGILRDDNLTGIYNAALTVGRIPYYIFYAMTIFLLPMISKSTSQNNHEETSKILNQSIRIMLILLVPMIVLMSIYAKPILFDFYGAKYLSAAMPMAILEYGVGFLTIFYVMSFALNGAGKTKIVMWISIFGFAINAILNYILIKKYSITGSAIATTIASFIVMVWILYYLWRDFKVSIKFTTALKTVFAAALTYLASLFFSKGNFTFIIWSAILFVFYLFILYILKEIKKDDIGIIQNLIKRKKKDEVAEELSGNEPEA